MAAGLGDQGMEEQASYAIICFRETLEFSGETNLSFN